MVSRKRIIIHRSLAPHRRRAHRSLRIPHPSGFLTLSSEFLTVHLRISHRKLRISHLCTGYRIELADYFVPEQRTESRTKNTSPPALFNGERFGAPSAHILVGSKSGAASRPVHAPYAPQAARARPPRKRGELPSTQTDVGRHPQQCPPPDRPRDRQRTHSERFAQSPHGAPKGALFLVFCVPPDISSLPPCSRPSRGFRGINGCPPRPARECRASRLRPRQRRSRCPPFIPRPLDRRCAWRRSEGVGTRERQRAGQFAAPCGASNKGTSIKGRKASI